jgi:hypothetical protein
MTAVALDSEYVDTLRSLGDLESGLHEAVRRYAVEQIGERIVTLQREIAHIQAEYSAPFEVVYARVMVDEPFVQELRRTHPTWERDLNTWEYFVGELSEWLHRLESISQR